MGIFVSLLVSIVSYAFFDGSAPERVTFGALVVVGVALQWSSHWRGFGAGLMVGAVVEPLVAVFAGMLFFALVGS